MIAFFIPVVKDLELISSITLVGLAVTMAFLLPDNQGRLGREALRIKQLALIAGSVWVVTTLGSMFLVMANILDIPIVDSMRLHMMNIFIHETSVGKSFLITILASLFATVLIWRGQKIGGVFGALISSFIALIAPVFQSHSNSSGYHGLAIGSLLFHILAISLWAGGVLGLIVINPSMRAFSITRFSSLALWCSLIVAASGVLNAWTRLNYLNAWGSLYAILVLLKVLLMSILIGIGARHRRYIAAKIGGSIEGGKAIFQLLTAELMIMVIAICIGGWMTTTQPPSKNQVLPPSSALIVTGIPDPGHPTLSKLFLLYNPDGAMLGLLILVTALYIRGILLLQRRGDKWPVGRTVSFIIGVALTDYATSGGLGIYAHFAFSYHMIAHMVIGMIAPIAFVLSAPLTLALRTLPISRNPHDQENERGVRSFLLTIMHSRYVRAITYPLVALAIFDGSLFVLYMTPIFGHLMASHSGHLFMNLHFLLAGILFFHVIVGVDPNPHKAPYIARIVMLFAAMSIHALFSIALMSATTPIDSGYFASLHLTWITNLLSDQHLGGAIGWAMGEVPILIALIATFIQWVRDDSRETRRIDRAAERAAAMGEDDDLAKYNKYLAELNLKDSENG